MPKRRDPRPWPEVPDPRIFHLIQGRFPRPFNGPTVHSTPSSGSDPVYKYTGKPQSSVTGLYYYGARWYDQNTGRFQTRDPLAGEISEPQSLNPYTYAANSPTTLTDPTGMVVIRGPDEVYRPDQSDLWFAIVFLSSLESHHNLNGAIGIEDYNPCLTLRCLGGLATGILGLLGLADLLGSGGQGPDLPTTTTPDDYCDPCHKVGPGGTGNNPGGTPTPKTDCCPTSNRPSTSGPSGSPTSVTSPSLINTLSSASGAGDLTTNVFPRVFKNPRVIRSVCGVGVLIGVVSLSIYGDLQNARGRSAFPEIMRDVLYGWAGGAIICSTIFGFVGNMPPN